MATVLDMQNYRTLPFLYKVLWDKTTQIVVDIVAYVKTVPGVPQKVKYKTTI